MEHHVRTDPLEHAVPAATNAIGAVLCGLATRFVRAWGTDEIPLELVFGGLAFLCMTVGLPASLSRHAGRRSLSTAIGGIAVALGGVAFVVRQLLA